MAEIPPNLPEWQKQLETASFIDTRRGDITAGTQFLVYTRPDLGFVVKVPSNEIWLNGYRLAQTKAPDLMVPFSVESNVSLKINHQRKRFKEVIIQEKVSNAQEVFVDAVDSGAFETASRITKEVARNDRTLFQRGLFTPDPSFQNAGVMKDGSVRCLDAGSFAQSYDDSLVYTSAAHSRAVTHLAVGFFLEKFSRKGFSFKELYERELKMKLLNIPNVPGLDALEARRLHPDTALLFACMGDDEFRRFAPNGAPHDIDINHAAQIRMLEFTKGLIA